MKRRLKRTDILGACLLSKGQLSEFIRAVIGYCMIKEEDNKIGNQGVLELTKCELPNLHSLSLCMPQLFKLEIILRIR